MLLLLKRDLQNTIRSWRRRPGGVWVALATLAMGIGGTTTIFSVLSSLLLAPLPVADAAHVFRVNGLNRNNQLIQMSMPDALDIKKRLQPGNAFALYRRNIRNLADRSNPVMVHVLEADADLFQVMGVKMAHGRSFQHTANQPGEACEVVISWAYWQSHFGAAAMTNRSVRLNERACVVDGILPQDLDLPVDAELWVPAVFDLHAIANGRRIRSWFALTHTDPNIGEEALNAKLSAIGKELSEENPAEDAGLQFTAVLLRDWLTKGVRTSVFILFAGVLGVLLMACANVANLQLAQASARLREVSVRVAVGASRSMLFQQLLTESLLLAFVSSVTGLAGTVFAVRFIRSLPDTGIPRPESIVVDWRVLLFAIFVAAFTGLLFGTLPALRVSMVSLTGVLKQTGGRITETRRQQAIRKILVGSETAIATVLLIASLLLVRSFQQVAKTDPGFQTNHLLTAFLSLPPERYGKDTMDLQRLAKKLEATLADTAGIQAATVATNIPLRNLNASAPVEIEGQPLPRRESELVSVLETDLTPSFRQTLGIPLLAGRDLEQTDDRENATAVLVNSTFAKTFFPNRNVIGARVRYNPTVNKIAPWQEIVGVLADTRQNGLEAAVQPEIYFPLARGVSLFPAVIIRTADNPGLHVRDIERAVHAADAEIPVFFASTMEQLEARTVGFRTFNTALLSGFAVLALLLASGGIFAVISYSVSQRTSEIGVRVACGATQSQVVGMIIRQGILPAVAGIAIGVFMAWGLTRFLTSLLYGVEPTDVMSYAAAILLLVSVAVAASLLPAIRAVRLDPWRALRYE